MVVLGGECCFLCARYLCRVLFLMSEVPLQVWLGTTGRVRFNPNLYEDGLSDTQVYAP